MPNDYQALRFTLAMFVRRQRLGYDDAVNTNICTAAVNILWTMIFVVEESIMQIII